VMLMHVSFSEEGKGIAPGIYAVNAKENKDRVKTKYLNWL